jgi:hypothetical protein
MPVVWGKPAILKAGNAKGRGLGKKSGIYDTRAPETERCVWAYAHRLTVFVPRFR